MSMLKVVLVTGISGSGKSVALRMLEDASYTCVDNLPVRFLAEFIANARDSGWSVWRSPSTCARPANWPNCPTWSPRCAPWAPACA